MMGRDIEDDKELQQVLWACLEQWNNSPVSPDRREVYYGWVLPEYERRFGDGFHHSKLGQLAKLGYLEKGDTSSGGSRRYYKLIDPKGTSEQLQKWGLSS